MLMHMLHYFRRKGQLHEPEQKAAASAMRSGAILSSNGDAFISKNIILPPNEETSGRPTKQVPPA